MSLSDQDKQFIRDAVAEGVKAGNCACGLTSEERAEMPHHMGMIKDLGKGNYGAGIEVMRDMLKFWSRVRSVGEKVGVAIVVFIAVSLFGTIGGLIWIGLKEKVSK